MFPTLKNLGINELPLTGSVFVSFGDIRESIKAYTKVKDMCPGWTVDFVATPRYYNKQNMGLPSIVFEAQVLVKANYGGPIEQFDSNGIGIVLKELFHNYGDVMAMDLFEEHRPVAEYRVEFHDSASIAAILQALNGFKIAVGNPYTVDNMLANLASNAS